MAAPLDDFDDNLQSREAQVYNKLILACAFAAFSLATSSAWAGRQSLHADMTGGQVVPVNASAAIGICVATVDTSTLQVTFTGGFTNLTSAATSAAIRGPAAAGENGPVLIASSIVTPTTTGTFLGNGSITPAQMAAVLSDQTYCEVDDAVFPSGEIRGQLPPAPAPALPLPSVAALFVALALGGVALQGSRGRSKWRLARRLLRIRFDHSFARRFKA